RDGAEQAFGVASVVKWRVFIEMEGHQMTVEPGNDVQVAVEEWDIAPGHARARHRNPADKDPVADEAAGQHRNFGGDAAVPEIKQADNEVTDRDALQHSVETHVNDVESREIIDHHAKSKQDESADDGVPRKLGRR